MKEIKLDSELNSISDKFLREISILTDPKYMVALEDELTNSIQEQELSDLKQKQLEKFAKTIQFVASNQVSNQLLGYWF